ncbi:glycosyl hydrolase family 88 [Pseudalgibacter alginicilyticus]|uniref:Glycosyl hydrolase family 88 n=1 Tax=Pseudalgibacter alginicilyticus TaxID=1736674 RepID=A0A0P0D8V3_9FLAO|nr:glycoside hydrolase family 88 protein [Pseudalgibacter alginicilyticus]ALJ05224.1 glycosyl hydrolase family 88 [Pseudalgibacter alginicilyticus]
MKNLKTFITGLIALLVLNISQAQEIKPSEVKKVMKRVADWQIEHFRDTYSNKKEPHHPLDWTNGALYTGMIKWAAMADDDTYYNWLKHIGETNNWNLYKRKYHADDHTVGQMYIELYRKYGDEKMIKPTKEQFEFILYHPSISVLNWKTPYAQDRWNWCDALFMSPPVWAQLYNLTGEKKYLDFMMAEFKASTNFLFDKKENLYYRDERYFDRLDNDLKIFWSRGNGWVFGGLVNIMNELNQNTKEYKYFLNIYKKMAKKILELQTPEGHWAMSLLQQDFYPTPETSGSSFFVFGLAWGINNNILNKDTYLPAVQKGWHTLVSHVTDDGMLGYVQPIGAEPGKAWADKTEVYGTGAFLSAGSEVYKLYNNRQ